jgi:Na+-translocating ferredoxin:NAD+ oxidoreductase subunit C
MKLKDFFRNGVHPPEMKELTASSKTRRIPFPSEVILPLSQHIGAPSVALVREGDRVERGDIIAEAGGFVSVPLHASVSGTVTKIARGPHPNGTFSPAIFIKVDQFSAQAPRPRMIPDWHDLDAKQLLQAIQDGGLVGLGGAGFPTHVKLSPPPDQKIDVVLLNGCECEPYLTTDHRSMVEYPHRVHLGTRIMMKALGVKKAILGIENNKPDAIEIMRKTVPSDLDIEIVGLNVKYPQGAEKMLIKALIDREVPEGGLPMHVGAVVQNVASVATIAEIFETGLPLVERILTVTGRGLKKPRNLIVPIGTKLRDLIAACGGLADDAAEVIMGGPMMGPAQGNLDTPILKGTSGVVVLNQTEAQPEAVYPCIRCGHCLDACPVFLNPQAMGSLGLNMEYKEMQTDLHLDTCMLCGCCSYVCPSKIPLSHIFGVARAQLAGEAAKERAAAQKAEAEAKENAPKKGAAK